MDSALCASIASEVLASHAHKAPAGVKGYYRCPNCFEPVFYNSGNLNKSAYFYHEKETIFSNWCDKRTKSAGTGIKTNSLLVRSPFPLYLQETSGSFELQVHFRPISDKYSDLSEEFIYLGKESMKYQIRRFIGNNYRVTLNFVPDDNTNFIGCERNITVAQMLNEWGRFLDYFDKEYALFKKQDGRKIRKGESVYSGNQYYLISKYRVCPTVCEFKEVGFLKVGPTKFIVQLFTVPDKSNDVLDSLFSKLGIKQLEQRAEPHIIWPPFVDNGAEKQCIWDKPTVTISIKSAASQEIWEEGRTIHTTLIRKNQNGNLIQLNLHEDHCYLNIAQSDMMDCLTLGIFNNSNLVNFDEYTFEIKPNRSNPLNSREIIVLSNHKGILRTVSEKGILGIHVTNGEPLKIGGPLRKLLFFNRFGTYLGEINSKNEANGDMEKLITRINLLDRDRVPIPQGFYNLIRKLSKNNPVLARSIVVSTSGGTVSRKVLNNLVNGDSE